MSNELILHHFANSPFSEKLRLIMGFKQLASSPATRVGVAGGLGTDEVVIARDDPRAGRVHVHFPRHGFQIRKVKTAS